MRRPTYPSDEARRLVKPHVRVHHSVTNHPRTATVWADNDLLARFLRVLMKASEKGAAHTGDVLTLHFNELPMCMGVTRMAPAKRALGALCVALAWHVVVNDLTRTVQITIRNFAKKQNLAPRQHVVKTELTPQFRLLPVPVPTPHSKEEELAPAALVLEAEDAGPAGHQVSAQEIIEAWRRICVPRGAPDLREITEERQRKLRQRLREHPTFEWWDEVFTRMAQSRFLWGNGKTGWRVSFDWLIHNDTNAVKILEGKYDDQANKAGPARR